MMLAVIYCRCSTEEESQQDALKQQVNEARQSVRRQGWTLVDEYIEAKSGTTTANRSEYNRLYEELGSDKFDIVVIKSQDRLMRNTKDWYLFIDRLISNGKRLFMYLDGTFYSADDALITGIKAILAEEYSKELSRKINNAHYHRQQDGRSFILPPGTYGLERNADGIIELVQEEAEAIRIMFLLCKSMGCISIGHYLEENGIYDRNGRPFKEETIRRIIRNPIRCGTVIQNRVHFDFQTKKTVKLPKDQWVVHENAVPAAVSRQEWKEANDAMDKRRTTGKTGRKEDHKAGKKCGQYPLSGKICCGECGSPYYRRYRKRYKDQKLIVEWRCKRYIQNGRKKEIACSKNNHGTEALIQGCSNIHLNEEKLLHLLECVFEQYFPERMCKEDEIIDRMMSLLAEIPGQKDFDRQVKKLKKEKERAEQQEKRLLDKLLEDVISDENYKEKKQEIQQRIVRISRQIEKVKETGSTHKTGEQRLMEIRKRLENGAVRQAGTAVMIDGIQEIKVFSEKLTIVYKVQDMAGSAMTSVNEARKIQKDGGMLQLDVPLGARFRCQTKTEELSQRILGYMCENPRITAKMIAEKEGISLSGVNARIRRLRQQGKICFDGKGGRGEWKLIPSAGNKGL